MVDISFKGADPQFVAAVANAFADEYQKISGFDEAAMRAAITEAGYPAKADPGAASRR